jgi:hypothetical protein
MTAAFYASTSSVFTQFLFNMIWLEMNERLKIIQLSISSGQMEFRKFIFCFLIVVRINSKIYWNVLELILECFQM